MQHENDHLILVSGKSATGKTASLMNFKNPEGVIYVNCEAGKKTPFKNKFKELKLTDPMDLYQVFTEAEQMDDVHTIVVDTLTYLMDMYESMYVLTSNDSRKMWGQYAQFFKELMQQYVARSTKNVIFLAHTADVMNESEMINETVVKVKGSLMNTGVESFFSSVVSTKKVPITKLKGCKSSKLNITPEEEALGFKYVYQTKLTKETVNERIRSPLGMWEPEETYVDNDAQVLLDTLNEYYN